MFRNLAEFGNRENPVIGFDRNAVFKPQRKLLLAAFFLGFFSKLLRELSLSPDVFNGPFQGLALAGPFSHILKIPVILVTRKGEIQIFLVCHTERN